MIFVSIGHSSKSKGASFKGFYEYDEAILWATTIQGLIETSADVVPPGNLKSKVKYINDNLTENDLAIEIHFNSAKDSRGNNIGKGCETLYYPGSVEGAQFATAINNVMAKYFQPNRGIKEGYYQMNPNKSPDYFLARTKCPAIIIEPDFIHRKEIIQNNRYNCCTAIAKALTDKGYY